MSRLTIILKEGKENCSGKSWGFINGSLPVDFLRGAKETYLTDDDLNYIVENLSKDYEGRLTIYRALGGKAECINYLIGKNPKEIERAKIEGVNSSHSKAYIEWAVTN